MKIDFKEESLYEHFSISTSVSKNELFRQFQTRPDLRKELPNYIQTINSEQKLFIDELFNTYIDNEKYSLVNFITDCNNNEDINATKVFAAFVDLIRNFDSAISTIKISGKVFDKIINTVYTFNDISKFNHSNCNDKEDVLAGFLESCLAKLEDKINSTINSFNSKSVNSLYRVISSLSKEDIKSRLCDAFISSLSNSLETLTMRLDDEKLSLSSISFVSGLTDTIFKNKELYPAYKYCCNKLLDSNKIETKDLLKIIKRLKGTDLKPLVNTYIEKALQFVLFENINKYEFEDISNFADIAETIIEIVDDNELDIENIDLIKIPVAFRDKGEEWYDKYKTSVEAIVEKRSLSSAIFNICLWVYQDEDLNASSVLFTNLILHASGFETRLNGFFCYINRLESKLEREYSYNEDLKVASLRQAIVSKQDEMLSIILDFYAITIISPELVDTFDQIYQLLMTNTSDAISRMRKCDSIRGVNLYHKNMIEEVARQRVSSYNTSSSGCYIASCVYGSYDCPQVWILRRYRDQNLGSSWFGKIFIKIYYAISPTLVKLFGKTKWFKSLWKKYLDKKVQKLKDAGYESTPYKDKKWH